MKKWENFLCYALIVGGILSIRLLVSYPPYILSLAESFLEMGQGIVEYFEMTEVIFVLQRIPVKVIFALMGIFHVVFGLIIYFLRGKKLSAGVTILMGETVDVIRKGLVLYGMIFILTNIFIYSLILLPLAFFLLMVAHVVVLVGKVPLAIYFGGLVLEALDMERKPIVCYGVGSIAMLLCESAYAIGNTFFFFIFPVLSLGVMLKLYLNWRIYGTFGSVFEPKREVFNRKKIRDIICDEGNDISKT